MIRTKKSPPVLLWRHKTKHLLLLLWKSWRMRSNWLHENFQGVMELEVRTQKLCRGGFKNLGRTAKYLVLVLKLSFTGYPIRPPPWAAYCIFTSGCLIAFDKHPGVLPGRAGETRRRLFSKVVLKVTGPESTRACQDDHLCDLLKLGIDVAVHIVQHIWDTNLTTEDW